MHLPGTGVTRTWVGSGWPKALVSPRSSISMILKLSRPISMAHLNRGSSSLGSVLSQLMMRWNSAATSLSC
ncbi:hypothetical protein D3C84_1191640 [compost metagenome]